ncbi:MAG: hypothetical protein DRQ78_04095 [Epsilonproteobacteria bacterium]|nr:MAG: hypothetical protein DRQ78_04095 [Campylobacterota bacterium]
MADTAIAKEPKLGLSEAMYNAQIIVDAFSKALQEKQCMSRIPIAVYTESEMFEERLISTIGWIGEDDNPDFLPTQTYTYSVPGDDPDLSDKQNPKPRTVTSEAQDFQRSWADECFDCGAEFPELDLDSLFDSILKRIKEFIEQIKNMFNFDLPNYCQFSYMLSYVCIPDLIAILALILAAILKLIGSIFLGTFSLLSFILGIIQTLIGALLRFALAMIRYAMKPISCLLDTLAEIANNIPTKETLQNRLSEEEYELLYGEGSVDGSQDLPEAINSMRRAASGVSADAGASIKSIFESIGSTVEKAAGAVDDSIEDMFGLVSYLECEPKRSGVSIFEKINEIIELVQIANIIMAIIDKKAANNARDKLCKDTDDGRGKFLSTGDDIFNPNKLVEDNLKNGLTPEEIAEVIEEAIGVNTTIVTDEDSSTDIGVLIKKEVEYQTRLNLYSCDIPDIITEYHVEPIVDRATAIPDDVLFGKGPGLPRTTNIERVTVSDAEEIASEGGFQFLPFDIAVDANLSVNDIIRDLISTRVKNNITNINDGSDASSIDKADSGLKEPDTIPSPDDYSLGILVQDAIPASTFNKTVELKCGSIANIEEQFSIFKDNT